MEDHQTDADILFRSLPVCYTLAFTFHRLVIITSDHCLVMAPSLLSAHGGRSASQPGRNMIGNVPSQLTRQMCEIGGVNVDVEAKSKEQQALGMDWTSGLGT